MNDDQFNGIQEQLDKGKKWMEIHKLFSHWFPSATAMKTSFTRYRQRYDK